MKGIDAYALPTKETWRGWQWNRIVDALCEGKQFGPAGKRERCSNAMVLYLVGPNDIDRTCATSRGFSNSNVVAIDIDAGRVGSVRGSGDLAVCDSLQRILLEWKYGLEINVIVADFCSGMVGDNVRLPPILVNSRGVVPNTVVSLNLLRGRDQEGDWTRDKSRLDYFLKMPGIGGRLPKDYVKHRGFHAAFNHWYYISRIYNNNIPGVSSEQWAAEMWRRMDCQFYSYPSNVNGTIMWFDSVVFRHSGPSVGMSTEEERAGFEGRDDKMRTDILGQLSRKGQGKKNCAGKLAALRAVRTTRLKKADA